MGWRQLLGLRGKNPDRLRQEERLREMAQYRELRREEEEQQQPNLKFLDRVRQEAEQRKEEEARLLQDFDEFTRTGIPPSNSVTKNPHKFDNAWFTDGSAYFGEGGTVIHLKDGTPLANYSDLCNSFHAYKDGYGVKAGDVIWYYDIFGEHLIDDRPYRRWRQARGLR
jgi:hypothetical protein